MTTRRVLFFNPYDSELSYRQQNTLTTGCYIEAKLPSYHFPSDRLHVYFEEIPGLPHRVIISKRLATPSSKYDVRYTRSITLSQLGFGVTWRRWLGRLKVIYVGVPRSVMEQISFT